MVLPYSLSLSPTLPHRRGFSVWLMQPGSVLPKQERIDLTTMTYIYNLSTTPRACCGLKPNQVFSVKTNSRLGQIRH